MQPNYYEKPNNGDGMPILKQKSKRLDPKSKDIKVTEITTEIMEGSYVEFLSENDKWCLAIVLEVIKQDKKDIFRLGSLDPEVIIDDSITQQEQVRMLRLVDPNVDIPDCKYIDTVTQKCYSISNNGTRLDICDQTLELPASKHQKLLEVESAGSSVTRFTKQSKTLFMFSKPISRVLSLSTQEAEVQTVLGSGPVYSRLNVSTTFSSSNSAIPANHQLLLGLAQAATTRDFSKYKLYHN